VSNPYHAQDHAKTLEERAEFYALRHGGTKEHAENILTAYEIGLENGRKEGEATAQRHLRLLLGLEDPNMHERATWQAPFPLKPKD
jgi:hypothetical protein